jgi:uncharacterized damage-inducible protein DinB
MRGDAVNEALQESFRHAAWASKTLLATLRTLAPDLLHRPVRGYGSVLATLNHLVLSDAGYAAILTGVRPEWARQGHETDDLALIESRVDATAHAWEQFLASPLDAHRPLLLEKGTYECPAYVVVAQALHHGAAHREQVRAGIADLGGTPPDLQPWAYADATGRSRTRPAPS